MSEGNILPVFVSSPAASACWPDANNPNPTIPATEAIRGIVLIIFLRASGVALFILSNNFFSSDSLNPFLRVLIICL